MASSLFAKRGTSFAHHSSGHRRAIQPRVTHQIRGYAQRHSGRDCEGLADPGCDLLCDIGSISANSCQHSRAERVLERQPAEEQPRSIRHDTAHLPRPTVGSENRQVDPVEHLPKAGAPHHDCNVKHAAVGEHGAPVLHAGHPIQVPLHTTISEVGPLDPDIRSAMEPDLLKSFAAHGCPPGEHMTTEEHDVRKDEPDRPAVQPYWYLTGVTTGQHG